MAACIQDTGRCTATYHSKKKMFEDFEKAKESVIQLLVEDIDMRLILEIYKEEPQQIAV